LWSHGASQVKNNGPILAPWSFFGGMGQKIGDGSELGVKKGTKGASKETGEKKKDIQNEKSVVARMAGPLNFLNFRSSRAAKKSLCKEKPAQNDFRERALGRRKAEG